MFGRRILFHILGELKEFGPVKGPLEIWPYPLVNLTIGVLKIFREVRS